MMNPMPSSTARKPRYDQRSFAGRKNGEVEFMGAKKIYHVKAFHKESNANGNRDTPSLSVVNFRSRHLPPTPIESG